MDHEGTAQGTTTTWTELEAAFASERLSPYLRHTGGDRDLAVRFYLWNIALCESLYPLLNLSEVTLRNRFHAELSNAFGHQDWFDAPWLDPRDAAKVAEAKQKIQRHRMSPTPGRVVAELTFGFWTSLLDVRYERNKTLWPQLAPKIFRNTHAAQAADTEGSVSICIAPGRRKPDQTSERSARKPVVALRCGLPRLHRCAQL